MKEMDIVLHKTELRDVSDLQEYVFEVINIYFKLREVYKLYKPYDSRDMSDEELVNLDLEDYFYYILDLTEEEILNKFEFPKITKYSRQLLANTDMLRRRLKDANHHIMVIKPLLEKCVEDYLPVKSNILEVISNSTYQALGNLNKILMNDFLIEHSLETISSNQELEVGHQVSVSMSRLGLDVQESIVNIGKDSEDFIPEQLVFDAHPELEEPFYDAVGSYVVDVDELEYYITLAEVTTIISESKISTNADNEVIKSILQDINERMING